MCSWSPRSTGGSAAWWSGADLGLAAYNGAGEPKRLELYPGGHFAAYTDHFERASAAATDWFVQHLRPAA
jgi:uncharacterized protein